MTPALSLAGLRFSYPDGREALRGLDLIVAPGERVAVLGPNGAGKTTLALHCNGVLRARAGSVTVDGLVLEDDTLAEIRRRVEAQAHDVYVLDEFTYPMKWGWVDVAEVVEVLAARRGRQHVIITGRDAPAELVAAADLVMETTKIKHPMDAGQKGQKGIEW